MYYYDKKTNQRLTMDQLIERGEDMTKLEENEIFQFTLTKPTNYDPELHDITEDGTVNEYYEEEVTISTSMNMPFMGMMPPMGNTPTHTVTVKGYRVKWILTAKPSTITKPILLARLTAKKHATEDAGVTLPDGTIIQSTEADRSRIAQLMISLVYLKVFNPTDVEFKQYMDELKFKVVDGVFRPISESDILYFFKVMAIRTLSCFERENVITGLIEAAYAAGDNEAVLTAYFNNIETDWPA